MPHISHMPVCAGPTASRTSMPYRYLSIRCCMLAVNTNACAARTQGSTSGAHSAQATAVLGCLLCTSGGLDEKINTMYSIICALLQHVGTATHAQQLQPNSPQVANSLVSSHNRSSMLRLCITESRASVHSPYNVQAVPAASWPKPHAERAVGLQSSSSLGPNCSPVAHQAVKQTRPL